MTTTLRHPSLPPAHPGAMIAADTYDVVTAAKAAAQAGIRMGIIA